MRYIKRTLSGIIQKSNTTPNPVIIKGISDCGKLSTIKAVYEKMPVISMHNARNIMLAGNNGDEFFKKYGTTVIIDNIEETFDLLKCIDKSYEIVLISDINISDEYSSYINCYKSYNLHGLSIYELANMGHMQKPYIPSEKQPCIISRKSMNYTYQLLWRGFLPDAALIEDNKLWAGIISKKVESILKNSIMGRINISNKLIFLNFLKELALNIGMELNISELAEKLDVAPNTIKSWVKLLESINFIYLLPPYYIKGSKRRYIKTPKIYMEDTGIAAWLLGLDAPEKLETYENKDKFFENFVILEILKSYHHNGMECRLYHYRDNLQVKIDLLIEHDNILYPVYINDLQAAGLHNAGNYEKAQVDKTLGYCNIICLAEKSVKLSENISAISIWEI